ncbi:MAG TPA: YihY family inner membrane protein [Dyella sp.]|uniref:YihY family inner membrane protein n=1 Tax=Dyella sp. TaxID=1869338 RepID=UPI002F92811F
MAYRIDRAHVLSFGRFMWQRFIDDKCFETAGALSYTTLVSLVPLTVAVLTVFAAFPMFEGARETLLDFVFRNFVPAAGDEVQSALQGFATHARGLTGISILVMLFSAISMMISIEERLNRVWRVSRARRWIPRLLLYWAALTLGPILMVGAIAVISYATALPLLNGAVGQFQDIGTRLLGTLPFVLTFLILLLMYTVIPNRRVPWRKAAIGALVGAVLFEVVRWGFTLFVRNAQTYQQIYGVALAALPILLLWIYLSWVIVILGASIAASISAFDYQKPSEALPQGDEFLGLLVVLKFFIDAQRGGCDVEPATIRAQAPYLHTTAIADYFDDLLRADLIRRSESGGWLLSRSLDSADLLRVYSHSNYRLPLRPMEKVAALGLALPDELVAVLERVAQSLAGELGTRLETAYPPSPSSKCCAIDAET